MRWTERGEWQPSNKTTIVTPKDDGLSVAYLCGLLNSELLDLWYAVRGKTPRARVEELRAKADERRFRTATSSAPDGWVPSDHVETLARRSRDGLISRR